MTSMRRPILDIRRWNVPVCEACGKGSERRELYVHPGLPSGSTLQITAKGGESQAERRRRQGLEFWKSEASGIQRLEYWSRGRCPEKELQNLHKGPLEHYFEY